ncbi:MAG: right-handed parallel beta-helix repeat-containing protein, partial [Thermoguttaceae bacterium]
DSKDFKFASVALDAPEIYKAGNSLEVAVRADASLNYDLSWFYVTEAGDVEITEAKGLTAFAPDAATHPIKIIATPIADVEGLCVSDPVEAIVDPYVPQFGINDPYDTTKRSFVTTWDAVPNATRYAVQKKNASGAWVKMTAFDVVDGQIVGNTRATLSEDGAQFSYSVNMAKIGVEETYRVVAVDANDEVVDSGEFTYNPVGLTVENDAYDLANGSQTLRAVTVQGIDSSLKYQWYYSTNDDPTNWQIVDGAASAQLVLSADEAAQNYNYKVLATDPNEDRQSVSYARADTLDAPTNLTRTVDAATGDLLLTWNADANLAADAFIVQYYRNDGEYSAWSDLPQCTIVANGDGTFSLTHVNGEKYESLRVRAVDETGWSEFKVAGSEGEDVEDSPFIVNTSLDVVDANDGVTSLREAISYYLDAQAAGTLPDGAKIAFDPKVFTVENHTIVLDADTSFNLSAPLVVDATALGFNVVLDATASTVQLFTVTGENADVTLAGLTIENASLRSALGGSIRVTAGATLNLSAFRVANSTGRFGGGIYVNNATLIIEDSIFDQNYAARSGAAIDAANYANVVVSNTIFENNNSSNYGGAVELNSHSDGTFTNCSFLDNTTGIHGAALYVTGGSHAMVVGGEFLRNASKSATGEAIYVSDVSAASLTNVAFDSNTPSDTGGDGTIETTETASNAILDLDAELLDAALIDLEEEITLF